MQKLRPAVDVALAHLSRFDEKHASFFGVSIDPADEAKKRVVGRVRKKWRTPICRPDWQPGFQIEGLAALFHSTFEFHGAIYA
jgi:hypothetical protein